ncbi:MAG: hypothetical protein RIF41_20700, partial [Polyangiaceae bacterium]
MSWLLRGSPYRYTCWRAEQARRVTTGERRVAAPEVALSCRIDGPDDGELVIAAHGFPDGPDSFDTLADALVASGRRV